jgi:hypothetical protein
MGLIEKFLWGLTLSLNFQRAFSMLIKNFSTVKERREFSTANLYQIWVKKSNGDVILGPARPRSGRNRYSVTFR